MFPKHLLAFSLFVIGTWGIEEFDETLPADTEEFKEILPVKNEANGSIKHASDSVSGIADLQAIDSKHAGDSISGTTDRQLIQQLIDTVKSLTQQNNAQLAMMNDMKSALQQQQQDMSKMEARLNKCEQAMDNAGEMLQSPYNENKINRDSSVGSRLPKETPDKRSRITRQSSGQTVAFSAVATNSVAHYGANNKDIPFEKVDVNIAGGYDSSTGVFTAPSAGIYVISASILAVANRETSCDIVINGIARARLYARGTDGRHDQGSQTVLFRLEKGDVVSVENEAADDAVHGGLYTTFSGFLLPEEDSSVSSIIG